MDHIEHGDEDVIELGVASIETKGPPLPVHDTAGGMIHVSGISDD